eukprot:gnl/TRDRNA2_/TRDRNA2_127660_c0_seq2.p1 gnl/TRDRNA2_/TRDRNA2_127660_c0~~gnl/TRDRNA2_/TRDRNA2_127660_c0_seq2.p1  ORF type:complete len:373 (-),score=59.73 gnl/TRDRNA2_/TRDRNA2_127660_c0_seq2:28-1146(-)
MSLSDLINLTDTVLPHVLASLHPASLHLHELCAAAPALAAVLDDPKERRQLLDSIAATRHLGPLQPGDRPAIATLDALNDAVLVLRNDTTPAYEEAVELVLLHAAAQLSSAASCDVAVARALRRSVWSKGSDCSLDIDALRACAIAELAQPRCAEEACKLLLRVGVSRAAAEALLSYVLDRSDDASALEWGFAALHASPWCLDGLEVRVRDALRRAAATTDARDIHFPGMGLHLKVCTRWTIAAPASSALLVTDFVEAIGPTCSFPDIVLVDELPTVAALVERAGVGAQLLLIVVMHVQHAAPVVAQISEFRRSRPNAAVVCCCVPITAMLRAQAKATHFKLNRAAGCSLRFVLNDLVRLLDTHAGVCSIPW